MTAPSPIEQLTAGLAADEALAQAAVDTTGPNWQVVDYGDEGIRIREADSAIPISPYDTNEETRHIERHHPKRVLAQVKAIREVLADHSDDEGSCARCWDGDTFAPASRMWPCPTVRALTSIYTEDETV